MKSWHWFALSAALAVAGLAMVVLVIQPTIESRDLRIVVGLVGGLLVGWLASQLALIGWYSR